MFVKTKARLRGLSIVEISLFAVVAMGLVIGGITFFQQANQSARVNDATRSIVGLQSGIRSLAVGASGFGSERVDLLPAAIASGSVSPRLLDGAGTAVNEWNSPIAIEGYRSGFVVRYGEVPADACIRLAPHTVTGNGPAGSGIAAVMINGILADANGDGQVDPAEAETACLSEEVEQPVVRWAFARNAAAGIPATEVEEMFRDDAGGSEKTETSRVAETEQSACGPGFSGQQVRSRDVVTYSDGSIDTLAWGDYDRSQCVEVTLVEEVSETEYGECPDGYSGQSSRSRIVAHYSNGSSMAGEWSDWDLAGCSIGIVSQTTETRDASCPAGEFGTASEQRTRTEYADGRVVYGDWAIASSDCMPGTAVYKYFTYKDLKAQSCGGSHRQYLSATQTSTPMKLLYNGQLVPNGSPTVRSLATCPYNDYIKSVTTQVTDDNCPSPKIGYRIGTQTANVSSSGVITYTTPSWSTSGCYDLPPSGE